MLKAGIFSLEQVILLPEDVLSVIGDMGPACAKVLQNHAKCAVLPLLGLQGNYDDPEIDLLDTPCPKQNNNSRAASHNVNFGSNKGQGHEITHYDSNLDSETDLDEEESNGEGGMNASGPEWDKLDPDSSDGED
jgi:hypothetical protein